MSIPNLSYLLLAALSASWASAGTLSVADGRVRETIPGQDRGVAYLSFGNEGGRDCQLLAVTSPAAARVEVHEHRHVDGRMQMRQVDTLILAAQGRWVLEPGGLHLMLLDLARPLRRGDEVSFHFDFGDCGDLSASLPVVAVGAD